jgi:hypothetical protein
MDELTQLKNQFKDLQKKVDDLYSTAGFPNQVIDALQKKGVVVIREILETPFQTIDGYESKYYYAFSKIGNKDMAFSNLSATDFVKVRGVSISGDTLSIPSNDFGETNPVTFRTSGTAPSPLVNGGTYYIKDVTADTTKLSSTSGGSAINITDVGDGQHFLQKINIIF